MCSFQSSKAAFELAVNGFRKSFSVKPVCLQLQKIEFPENDFNLTEILLLWPENGFTLSFYLQTISGSRAKERERARERERKKSLPRSSKASIAEIVCRNRPPSHNRDQRFVQSRSRSCEAPRQSRSRLPTDRDRAKCLDLMIFFWVLFVFLYWEMNDIIYSFGNRENMRKCEQQVENVFSIVFSRTQPNTKKYLSKYFLKFNQTHENIFLFEK